MPIKSTFPELLFSSIVCFVLNVLILKANYPLYASRLDRIQVIKFQNKPIILHFLLRLADLYCRLPPSILELCQEFSATKRLPNSTFWHISCEDIKTGLRNTYLLIQGSSSNYGCCNIATCQHIKQSWNFIVLTNNWKHRHHRCISRWQRYDA